MVRMTQAEYYALQQKGLAEAAPGILTLISAGEEAKLHDAIMAECKARKWQWIHNRMDKRSTTAPGVPDFVILADKGRVFFVECKTRTGKLTTEQQAFKHHADYNGHTVHVVRSPEEFGQIVDATLKNPTERILELCADAYGVEVEALKSKDRHQPVSDARSLAMYLLVRHAGQTSGQVAEVINCNRSNVSHAVCRVEERLTVNIMVRSRMEAVLAACKEEELL